MSTNRKYTLRFLSRINPHLLTYYKKKLFSSHPSNIILNKVTAKDNQKKQYYQPQTEYSKEKKDQINTLILRSPKLLKQAMIDRMTYSNLQTSVLKDLKFKVIKLIIAVMSCQSIKMFLSKKQLHLRVRELNAKGKPNACHLPRTIKTTSIY